MININGKDYSPRELSEILKNIPKDVIRERPEMINWDEIFDGRPEGATSQDGHYYTDENGERQWIDY